MQNILDEAQIRLNHLFLLLLAAFFAGGLNAAAGGGTFLTLPALMAVGVPAVSANATGTVALLPGYMASTWGFREELSAERSAGTGLTVAVSLVGGAIGAALLLGTSNESFRLIVPWLMALATMAFAIGPWLISLSHRSDVAGRPALAGGVFAVSIYGGYFNGGLGIMLLALLGLLGYTDLNFMNGYKNLISTVLTAIAVAVYALGNTVVWRDALIMMAAAVVGGYAGARAARRLPRPVLRYGIVAVGAATTIFYFIKAYAADY
jgi:uncharacterized membrane protein YfcA